MGRKHKNIKIQLNNRLNSLLRIGESKHKAKQEYKQYCQENNIKWNPAKTVGIHSIRTVEAYRQTINDFGDWLKANHKEIRNIEQIDKNVAYEYLKYKEKQGNTAWSVSKDMSAINKCLNLNLNKAEGGLQRRSYKDITRSRGERQHDQKYNAENYKNQILLAKAFGVRRETIYGGQYQAKDVSLYSKDGNIYIRVIEKGGRYRETQCLKSYQDDILKTFNVKEGEPLTKEEFISLYNSSSNYLFDRYTTKIDNHAFRSEYATLRYEELVNQKQLEGEIIKNDYRGYDKDLVLQVSQDLGHNRPSVVIEHYLR